MQSGHGRCCCWLDRFFPVKVDRTSEPHWLPRSTARSERASRTGGSPQARGCPPGAIWLLNWAFPAAPCVRPTNVSLRSNSRLASGRQELVWLERQPLSSLPERSQEPRLLPELFYEFGRMPLAFQMGVPAQDAFPFKLWSRIMTRETRRAAAAPVTYPDPRGDPELRKEVAAYLGLARGLRCSPAQVLVTGGFSGALGLAIRSLQLERMGAWIEDPGFPLTRTALGLAGTALQGVPVASAGLADAP